MLLTTTPTLATKLQINLSYKIIKRFYPGPSPTALFKGVSGAFTLSDTLFNLLQAKPGILPFHLNHFLARLPRNTHTVQDIYK